MALRTKYAATLHATAFTMALSLAGALPFATLLRATPRDVSLMVAQQAAEPPATADTPEAKMNRRFPQKVKVGDLVGLPMLDDNDVTLGRVQQVVRTPEGKIKLIVFYSRWFGWFGRPVAVPIEVVAILAKQIASVDMEPPEYAKAPTWMPGNDRPIPDAEIIRIAVTRR
jgi:hypothetical protein